ALALKEVVLSSAHPDIAFSLAAIATPLYAMGKFEEALAADERALEIVTKWNGVDDVLVAGFISCRGDNLLPVRKTDQSRVDFTRALQIMEKHVDRNDERLAFPLAGMCAAFVEEGQPRAAINPSETALKLGLTDWLIFRAFATFHLGRALYESGRDVHRGRA